MKAIAAFPGRTEPCLVEVREPPEPGPGEILAKTLALGVCGTDREILESAQPAVPAGDAYLVLGHECLGEVVAVGTGVTEFAVGDWVVPMVRRPLVAFERPVDFLAPGQFVERGIFHAHGFSAPLWLDRPEFLVKAPKFIEELAVLIEPLAVVEKGLRQACLLQQARLPDRPWPSQYPRVLVTGLGPIAFAALLSCIDRRWPTTVYGRDPQDASRPQLVRRLGGRYVPDTQWQAPENVERNGWDLLMECTGSAEVLVRTSPALATGGIAVWLGSSRNRRGHSTDLDLLMRLAVIRNHLHVGSVNSSPVDFIQAKSVITNWYWNAPTAVRQILTDHVRVEQSLGHFCRRTPGGIKTVVVYR